MFIVTYRIQGNLKSSVEIIQTLQGISDKVKKKSGCASARVYVDTLDENTFFLVEEWQKQRNLEEHVNSDLFAALRGIKGLLVKSPEIKFMVEN